MRKVKANLSLLPIIILLTFTMCACRNSKEPAPIEKDFTDIFSADLYECSYQDGLLTVKKRVDIGDDNNHLLYTEDDIGQLNKDVLDYEYQWELVDDEADTYGYMEFTDGIPTGKAVRYICSEEGYIKQAYYVDEIRYELESKSVISREEALDIGYAAIKEKYGDDTYFDEDELNSFHSYEWDFSMTSKSVCYSFEAIEGHKPEYEDSIVDPISFYITVSIDGEFVAIASSLRY